MTKQRHPTKENSESSQKPETELVKKNKAVNGFYPLAILKATPWIFY